MATETVRSIGTLGALAMLCQGEAARAAVVVSSSVVNVPVVSSVTMELDIDGDSVADFQLFGNHFFVELSGLGSNEVAKEPDGMATVSSLGDTVGAGLSYQTLALIHQESYAPSPSALVTFSVGFHFIGQDSLLHYGWFNFEFPGGNSETIAGAKVVSAAWESVANTGVTIIAVPEPASYVAFVGAGLGFWALWRNQKHPGSLCR